MIIKLKPRKQRIPYISQYLKTNLIESMPPLFEDNEDSIENYSFIEEIEDMLYVYGLPLNDQTLQRLLDDYGLTLAELTLVLA